MTAYLGIVAAVAREEPAVVQHDDGRNVVLCQVAGKHWKIDIIAVEVTQDNHIWLYLLELAYKCVRRDAREIGLLSRNTRHKCMELVVKPRAHEVVLVRIWLRTGIELVRVYPMLSKVCMQLVTSASRTAILVTRVDLYYFQCN